MDPNTKHEDYEGENTMSTFLATINADIDWADELGEIDLADRQHGRRIKNRLVHSHAEVIEGSRLHQWLQALK